MFNNRKIPVNSPRITVTAPKVSVNFSESIIDNTNIDPAIKAIEIAMLFNVLAFNVFCKSLKVSVTPDNISFILSTKPPAEFTVLFKFLINVDSCFPIPTKTATLNKSYMLLNPPVPRAFLMESIKNLKAFPRPFIMLVTAGPAFCIMFKRNSITFVNGINLISTFPPRLPSSSRALETADITF